MIGAMLPTPVLEQQPCRQAAEGHAVAAVAESEQMPGVVPVRTHVGQAVRSQRKQTLPGCLNLDLSERRKQTLEVGAQLTSRGREHSRARLPWANRTIGTAKQQAVLARPSRVVVGTIGIPHHDVSKTDIPALAIGQRSCRKHVGAVHAETAGEWPEVARRIAGGNDDT